MAWTSDNTSAAVAGGSGFAGGLLQFFGAKKQQQRIFDQQDKMYSRQRADALADWQMQNAYNSPEQQMQRLKDAGLNPNLVYGNGATATSAQGPRSSDFGNPQTVNTMQGLGSAVASLGMSYVDMKAKTAQTDNIRAQNQQILEQIRAQKMDNAAKAITYMTEAQTKNIVNDATGKVAMAKAKQELYNLSATGDNLDATTGAINTEMQLKHRQSLLVDKQLSTEDLKQKIMQDENTRAWIMNSTNVQEAKSRIVSMAVANAKSEAEKQSIIEATKGKQFENWFQQQDKSFYENLGSKAGVGSSKWIMQQLIEIGKMAKGFQRK